MTDLIDSRTAQTTDAAQHPTPSRPTIGDPGSWAILAFSTTSLMLGLYNGDFVNAAGSSLVIPVALFFGGGVQILVAVLEVIRGNTFGAAVFGCFGPFWVIYGLIETTYANKVVAAATAAKTDPAEAVASALTVFLAMFTILAFIFFIASLRTDAVLVTVLALLVVALILLMIGIHGANENLVHASGYVTVVFAALGLYRGAADIIADTFGRPVLPVFRLRQY